MDPVPVPFFLVPACHLLPQGKKRPPGTGPKASTLLRIHWAKACSCTPCPWQVVRPGKQGRATTVGSSSPHYGVIACGSSPRKTRGLQNTSREKGMPWDHFGKCNWRKAKKGTPMKKVGKPDWKLETRQKQWYFGYSSQQTSNIKTHISHGHFRN